MTELEQVPTLGLLAIAICAVLLAVWATGPWPASASSRLHEDDLATKLLERARWMLQLRWIAVAVVTLTSLLAVLVLAALPMTSLVLLMAWNAVLVWSNFVFGRGLCLGRDLERWMTLHLTVDLIVVTGLLSASGGLENPLYLAYVFPVTIGATLLPARRALGLTLFGCSLFCMLSAGEASGLIPHVTLELFPHGNDAEAGHAAHELGFVVSQGASLLVLMLVSWYLTALLRGRLEASEVEALAAARGASAEHQRLERVVQAAGIGMMVVEPGVEVAWSSKRAQQWVSGAGGGRGPCPLRHVAGCSICVSELSLESGRPAEAERSVFTGSETRTYRHLAEPVLDESGRCVQVVEVIDDITQRKALEADALHAGKLALLGQLAAGIAHEIGNPIASLMTRLKRLERRHDPEFVGESLRVLKAQILRIDRTIKNIAGFSRVPPVEWKRWPLNPIVEEALGLVRFDARALRMTVGSDLLDPSPMIWAVRDQMIQVVLNLLLNAVEAAPKGGEVLVRSFTSSGKAVLEVRDNGVGISPEVRERIFEPFMTTKESGVGLGLAISRNLVDSHGGSLEVESASEGSCFRVVLPTHGIKDSGGAACVVQ